MQFGLKQCLLRFFSRQARFHHLQFKFAPWAVLRIGRKRVLEFLEDTDYAKYLGRLER